MKWYSYKVSLFENFKLKNWEKIVENCKILNCMKFCLKLVCE